MHVFRNISIHLAIFRLACARAAMRCLFAAPSLLRTCCAVLIPDGTRSRTVGVHERRTVPTLPHRWKICPTPKGEQPGEKRTVPSTPSAGGADKENENAKKRRLNWHSKCLQAAGFEVKFPEGE